MTTHYTLPKAYMDNVTNRINIREARRQEALTRKGPRKYAKSKVEREKAKIMKDKFAKWLALQEKGEGDVNGSNNKTT